MCNLIYVIDKGFHLAKYHSMDVRRTLQCFDIQYGVYFTCCILLIDIVDLDQGNRLTNTQIAK